MSCRHEHEESELISTIQVGKKVPRFTIQTYNPAKGDFDEVSLKGLQEQGKWTVLFFYPADFTFVCPTELADLADQHAKLAELNVEVISMSADTCFAHMAWRKSEMLLAGVRFQMGEDPTGYIRNVPARRLSDTMDTDRCVPALKKVLTRYGKPDICARFSRQPVHPLCFY